MKPSPTPKEIISDSVPSAPESAQQNRTSSPNAPALDATDKNPATSADAPSNASGHQKWKGTSDNLNASPTITSMMPSETVRSSGSLIPPDPPVAATARR